MTSESEQMNGTGQEAMRHVDFGPRSHVLRAGQLMT